MKISSIILCMALLWGVLTYGYNGETLVTKRTEEAAGIHFDVSFKPQDKLIFVTVKAPPKRESLPLSEIVLVIRIKDVEQLRVTLAGGVLEDVPDAAGKVIRRPKPVARPGVNFLLSSEMLEHASLDMIYSADPMNRWTYTVDLKSYSTQ